LSPEQRALLRELVRRGLTLGEDEPPARLSFRDFVTNVRPSYRWYEHCERLAAVLQRVADGEVKRLMIFMPPRHGKSELVSRLFSAYWLYRYPHQWVGLNSYGAELAYTLSRSARENFQAGGGQVKSDAAAVKHWETGGGGGLWAAGVGGPITGKGWHLGIIDDPLKNAEEAESPTIREKQKEWYGSTFYTREEPGSAGDPDGALILIQTRWHDDDLAGWLLSEESEQEAPESWHVVSWEAIKDDAPPEFPPTCTVEPDWRREGEALCPERRPVSKLRQIAARIGEYFFASLFQQRPRPRAGALFPPGSIGIVDAAPTHLEYVRYWDKAGAKPGKGDWTVGVLMGRSAEGRFYVVDVVRGQWPADERNKVIRQTAELDATIFGDVGIYVEQPPGLAKESTDAVVRLLAGFSVRADPVNKDKVERAEPLSAQCRAGNVSVVRSDNTKAYLAVMHAFPFGQHDDDVDASSGAFNKLAQYAPATWGPSPFAGKRW
jgi:predicted phage terminase large subunit-like protein